MSSEFRSAADIAKELGLYLKVVTSTKSFENYNSFFNIYDEFEEPCRRIVVLTPYENLEEVIDYEPCEKIKEFNIIDGNLWIKEYPLTVNPSTIDINNIVIPVDVLKNIK